MKFNWVGVLFYLVVKYNTESFEVMEKFWKFVLLFFFRNCILSVKMLIFSNNFEASEEARCNEFDAKEIFNLASNFSFALVFCQGGDFLF